MIYKPTAIVLQEIAAERLLQDEKWGEQNHDKICWLAILGEEFGEACKAQLGARPKDYRSEMLQIAAVAVAAVESFDRNK